MAGERRVKNEDGGEREERCEFTRQVRGWFHALLSSGATTIPGIRYAGPLVTSRQTVSVVSQLVHAVCVLASVLAHWNAPDNADLKNYAARHRSSLSRGTAGQRDQGEQDAFVPFFRRTREPCICFGGRALLEYAAWTCTYAHAYQICEKVLRAECIDAGSDPFILDIPLSDYLQGEFYGNEEKGRYRLQWDLSNRDRPLTDIKSIIPRYFLSQR